MLSRSNCSFKLDDAVMCIFYFLRSLASLGEFHTFCSCLTISRSKAAVSRQKLKPTSTETEINRPWILETWSIVCLQGVGRKSREDRVRVRGRLRTMHWMAPMTTERSITKMEDNGKCTNVIREGFAATGTNDLDTTSSVS